MQVDSNPFRILPVELLGVIYSYLDQDSLDKFSFIDKTIQKMSWELIQFIRLFPHYSGSKKNADKDTLLNIIQRYPNAIKLVLGPKGSLPSTSCEGFGRDEETLLRTMIAFFKAHPELPFRKINLHEMDLSAELHCSLIESFKLSQMHSIVIRALGNQSVLQSVEVQPILSQGVNLKKFRWLRDEHASIRKEFSDTMAIAISFQDQLNLISAKFRHLHIHLKTIKSLKLCSKLETLVLDQCYFKSSKIKTALPGLKLEKLKRLEMVNITILSDLELETITKSLSNLEILHISVKSVGDVGFKSLKKNCPKLREIKICYPTAKDQELEYLAQNFPNLEMLSFEGLDISAKGIESLVACSKLRILKIGNLKNLETLCLKTLPQALMQLKVLEINHIEILNVKELPTLIQSMPNLVYLQIKNGDNIKTQDHLTTLRKQYPQLLELPPTRKIQKFLA